MILIIAKLQWKSPRNRDKEHHDDDLNHDRKD
jgi:hypothetical protein